MSSPLTPLILPALLIGITCLGHFVIRNRWYVQALLVVTAIVGLICSVVGLRRVTRSLEANDITGVLVLLIGVVALVSAGVMARKLQKGRGAV